VSDAPNEYWGRMKAVAWVESESFDVWKPD
jgi:hypothetical protein